MTRLAIIATHPVQYYAPWYRYLASETSLEIRVFYLWDFGVTAKVDPDFGTSVCWDVPLLEGYGHQFVPNTSADPGTHHPAGMVNPSLLDEVTAWNPDVVLMQWYSGDSTRKFLARWDRSRAPILFRGDSHFLGQESGLRRLAGVLWRRHAIFSRINGFLVVGKANRVFYERHGIPARRLFDSPHCVDNDRFVACREKVQAEAREWRASLGIPENDQVVLFAGKLTPRKGPDLLLESFRKWSPNHVTVLIVGSGELEEKLRQQASEISTPVVFVPFQNQSRMPMVYAAGDLLVMPSRGNRETWGLVVNEAFCMGTPALVSDVVGCGPDLIVESETGMTFDAGNPEALTAALGRVAGNASVLNAWGESAFRRVTTHFSYRQATEGLIEACNTFGRDARFRSHEHSQ
jgi:glycosyltransferase involved in cell wall biosynthesis